MGYIFTVTDNLICNVTGSGYERCIIFLDKQRTLLIPENEADGKYVFCDRENRQYRESQERQAWWNILHFHHL